jgi:hypothetical protein
MILVELDYFPYLAEPFSPAIFTVIAATAGF